MEIMRDTWTDERLDDFRGEMGEFRREMRTEFAALRQEMREEFAALHLRFDSLQRTMTQLCGALIVALIGFIATQA